MNIRTRCIVLPAGTAATALILALPGTATAGPSDYGQHVRHCAQTMGLSGEHNPGMHQGNAGWDGMACHS